MNERELAEAFSPCTLAGLTVEWDRMNREITAIRKERDAIAAILLSASVKGHNGARDFAFREGAIIGEAVRVQARWHLADDRGKWSPRLEYVKEDRRINDNESSTNESGGTAGHDGGDRPVRLLDPVRDAGAGVE